MRDAVTNASYNRLRAFLRMAALLAWTGVLLIPSLTTRLLTGRASRRVISLWYRGCCRLLGLSIKTVGQPETGRPVLFVANHVSYLDILLIGGMLKAHFIAKSEVQSWPGIGPLASLAGTLYVERRARRSREQRDVIGASLADGNSLVLFPEGTSSDGSRVLPFKSSLFSVFQTDEDLTNVVIQPVTIDYMRFKNGVTIDGGQRDLYAWYGDMTLAPHLGQVFGLPGAEVGLVWHDIIEPTPPIDRKALAQQAEEAVADGLAALREQPGPQDRVSATASADAA
jgi:1-acyl-sn-glycerol-3-phosphate acyltransferase